MPSARRSPASSVGLLAEVAQGRGHGVSADLPRSATRPSGLGFARRAHSHPPRSAHHPSASFSSAVRNFDPSHLIHQGVDPAIFARDFADRIYHTHIKDAHVRRDGRAGILGSFLTFGDARRGWEFRSPGHGDINFDELIRALNDIGYQGPLSVEWEDSRMDREHGAAESAAFCKRLDFKPAAGAFDAVFSKDNR